MSQNKEENDNAHFLRKSEEEIFVYSCLSVLCYLDSGHSNHMTGICDISVEVNPNITSHYSW